MKQLRKGAIIYRSKYGSTHQYAEWLGDRLDLHVYDPTAITSQQLAGFDFLIVGSPIYFGKMLIKSWLEKNREVLAGKKIFLFIVCGTPAADNEKIRQISEDNIPRWLIRREDVYFLPGKLVIRKLSLLHRFLLKMGARAEKDPKKKAAMMGDIDGTSPDNLKEIMQATEKFRTVPENNSQVPA